MGPQARTRVGFSDAADPGFFHSDNRSSGGRALNRSVLIGLNKSMDFDADRIEGKPKWPRRDSVDCTPDQKAALNKAHPMAVGMGQRAYDIVGGTPTPEVARLLRKYFHDDSESTREQVRA